MSSTYFGDFLDIPRNPIFLWASIAINNEYFGKFWNNSIFSIFSVGFRISAPISWHFHTLLVGSSGSGTWLLDHRDRTKMMGESSLSRWVFLASILNQTKKTWESHDIPCFLCICGARSQIFLEYVEWSGPNNPNPKLKCATVHGSWVP